ncbi:MAG: tetratricopeptide repeat protein [Acidobacteriales bacterium]|nr:tetratricopeptide repeat protein [Terriglobales bacterium]
MAASAVAQGATTTAHSGAQLVVVLPFENQSKAPGLEWIGESFPEVLGPRLVAARLMVVSRDDRLYAFDRLGIPAHGRISRATVYRIAQEMDADYVVLGRFNFDGKQFTARAQVLDLRKIRITNEVVESGALTQLVEIQNALAWGLLRQLDLMYAQSKQEYAGSTPRVRLDALENYIRGTLAARRQDRVKYFKEAVKLNPDYAAALLALGKAYFESKEYEAASATFGRVTPANPLAAEANFFRGLAEFYLGNNAKAAEAFRFTADRIPLVEVYNNLGVVSARMGTKDAAQYFDRATQADSKDPDYHFNLGVVLYRNGDLAGAQREIKQTLAILPQDAEAATVLQAVTSAKPYPKSPAEGRQPLERIKRNYDETAYRQLESEIQNANEARLQAMPAREHARQHVIEGQKLLSAGQADAAETVLREAILLDPTNAQAHVGLGTVLEGRGELSDAWAEAATANRLEPSVVGHVLMARVELRQNRLKPAAESVERALKLDGDNPDALALKREIEEKQAALKPGG